MPDYFGADVMRLTHDELERQAYITGDVKLARLYAELLDNEESYAEVDDLRGKINELEYENEELEDRISELEARISELE